MPAKAAGTAETTPANAKEKATPGEKLPGGKSPLNAAPNVGEKTPLGIKPNSAAAPANGEKPMKPEPLNAPKAEEKLPAETAPKGSAKLPEAEKARRKDLAPNGAEKPQGLGKLQEPKKPGESKKPEKPEKPQGLLTSPGGAKPTDRAMSAGPARPERAAASERKPPRAGGKEQECGKPGKPACPR